MKLTLSNAGIAKAFMILPVILVMCSLTSCCIAQSFKEVSKSIGVIHFQHDPNLITGGIAIFDFNNDGFEDLYLTGGLKEDRLYENDGSGLFIDVSDKLDSDLLKIAFTHGVAVGDIDNDGYDDILVTTHKGYGNILLINYQGERFIDVSGRLKSSKRNVWSTSASMGDIDMDGDLDIYVGNFADYDTDKFRDESISKTIPNTLYINNGGSFTDEAESFNVADEGSTLAVSFTDVNGDGYPDIYVGNDHGKRFLPNALYLNNPTENTFEKTPVEMGADVAINSMGIAIGDYDEDQDLDYYVTHLAENVLLNNDFTHATGFTDQSSIESVESTNGVSWGAVFFDYDNDSFLDLYVANGDMFGADIPQKNVLYQRKSGKFSNVSDDQGVSDASRSRGVATGDLNNDGLLDLAVVTVSAKDRNSIHNSIFQNENIDTGHWSKVQLEGSESNRNAYGSLVRLFLEDRVLIREVDGGSSYLSHNSSILHFGLGSATIIDSLEVQWPGGYTETYRSLEADKLISIKEKDNLYYAFYTVIEKECEQDSVLIHDKFRTLPGVYSDTSKMGMYEEVRLTSLKPPRRKSIECNLDQEIPESTKKDIFIYPNPFENELSVILNKMEDYGALKIDFINTKGKTVLKLFLPQTPTENNTITISKESLNKLPTGLYLMNVHSASDDGRILYSRRTIKY
ncbi:T9SS type A sorting domain-containing protein [Fulvivirga sp. M361]|uniref:FG-GAP-like repeat-containing protein n=1 Tax=Fulvivirga sp. M361 TaxID=2594266 RepID=UPI00117B3DA0|nr:FG-GAP-like repeat-containing protein [Fulvivirga sp. M361]TRX53369.1 T9SS type A sorting domain-containing protein [Fulvivirga sp. M361]